MAMLVTGSAGHLGEALVRTLRGARRAVRGTDLRPSPLEEAAAADVRAFVFTSSTSALGEALTPGPGEAAAWVTEETVPVPKNIYGVTKGMAESLCELVARKRHLPVVVLRTARFFPDEDDDAGIRGSYALANVQANEMPYRRVDLEDVVKAHLLAVERAAGLRFARYIVSATTPFTPSDLTDLRRDAPGVVRRLFPECESLYATRGWKLFPQIERVYVNRLARGSLDWRPTYDFRHVMESLRANRDFVSPLARSVGSKGYHDVRFANGPYPVPEMP